jgi:hypothetical protein
VLALLKRIAEGWIMFSVRGEAPHHHMRRISRRFTPIQLVAGQLETGSGECPLRRDIFWRYFRVKNRAWVQSASQS